MGIISYITSTMDLTFISFTAQWIKPRGIWRKLKYILSLLTFIYKQLAVRHANVDEFAFLK